MDLKRLEGKILEEMGACLKRDEEAFHVLRNRVKALFKINNKPLIEQYKDSIKDLASEITVITDDIAPINYSGIDKFEAVDSLEKLFEDRLQNLLIACIPALIRELKNCCNKGWEE